MSGATVSCDIHEVDSSDQLPLGIPVHDDDMFRLARSDVCRRSILHVVDVGVLARHSDFSGFFVGHAGSNCVSAGADVEILWKDNWGLPSGKHEVIHRGLPCVLNIDCHSVAPFRPTPKESL